MDPGLPFADTLARAWLDRAGGDPVRSGDGLILLPTRRSTRTLADAFLRAARTPALLLPRIEAIGDIEDATRAPLARGLAPLPPAIERTARLAILARLVLARNGRDGAPRTLDRAWPLAVELAGLLDEAAREGVALGAALRSLAPAGLAQHWEITLDFLRIVTEAWPAILAERGVLDPADRQARLLMALARHWRASPPGVPVWLAGVNALGAPEACLAETIAAMPGGLVLLPGLDRTMAPGDWDAIGPTHPQAGLRRLLARIGARREDVLPFAAAAAPVVAAPGVAAPVVSASAPPGAHTPGAPTPDGADGRGGRVAFLRRALLPADAVARSWRDGAAGLSVAGMSLLVAADEGEEAVAIALALRDAATAGRVASLVTPDRALAVRVSVELRRFGILADDSAGEPLADTPPAVLLRLVVSVFAEEWAPATLLALLRHPLAAFGTDRAACRAAASALETEALRGPRLRAGTGALRQRLDGRRGARAEAARALLDRIDHAFAPLAGLAEQRLAAPAALLDGLIAAAERAASARAGEAADGAAALWSGTEGEALAAHLASLRDALAGLVAEAPDGLGPLIEASMAGVAVHGSPVLRGRDAARLTERVAILGLLEARFQAADLLILGGLVEGVWPRNPDPGPWMGRPMRAAVGLPSPEERVGGDAHDFANLAASAPAVVLSRSDRRDRAPAVPSRFLARIEAALAGAGLALPRHAAVAAARALDQPPGGIVRPASPPAPRPPVARRPRRLGVTAIDTWQRDPYAIYARHVLGIRELPALAEDADHALFGTVVHEGLAAALADGAPPDADRVARALVAALDRAGVRPGLAAWWRPRLARIAAFVAAVERERPAAAARALECAGEAVIEGRAGPFRLTGRADRIERDEAGALTVLDYKTGQPPARREVEEGWAAQLPLEAAMAARGGFGPDFAGADPAALVHVRLSGGAVPGTRRVIEGDAARAASEAAWRGLRALVDAFDDDATPYLASPRPGRAPRFAPYAALARVAEWRLGEDEGEAGA